MTEIHLKPGYDLKQIKHKVDRPSFDMVGNGKMNHKLKVQSIDLLQEVAEMNSDEKFCFFMIKDKITWDEYDKKYICQVRIYSKHMTQGERNMFSRGFKLLNHKDIVRRVKRGTYMINPSALIPKDFEHEWKIWTDCESLVH
jgi:hypothetical protein